MASVRNLKKDIDAVMSMALSDCFYVTEYNKEVDEKAVYTIASDIVKKHREFRIRAIHPDGKDNPLLVKKHYRALVKDMFSTVDGALEKLSAEVKKVAK